MDLEKTTFLELFLEAFGSQFRSVWPPRGSRRVPMDPQRPLGVRLVGHLLAKRFFSDFRLFWGSPKVPTAVARLQLWEHGKTPLRHLKQ